MGKSDTNMAAHVRSVKRWLEKAEQSYDSKADIQGELNLMLAEAEMKNLRKNHAAGQRILRFSVVALMVVLICGVGVVFRLSTPAGGETSMGEPRTGSIPSRIQLGQTAPVQEKDSTKPSQSADLETTESVNMADQATAAPEQQAETVQPSAPAERETVPAQQYTAPASTQVLSERQMQNTIQDARHSLRGGTTNR